MRRYFEGLKFGLLLQLAVGPMCLMVFNTAKNIGFLTAFVLVLAIALVDAVYITLAGLGASKILEKEKVKTVFKIVGSIVLIIFGINIVLNVFGINIIPGLNVEPTSKSIFIQGIILTLSNPITIIFWGSVLTAKIIEDKLEKKELIFFFNWTCFINIDIFDVCSNIRYVCIKFYTRWSFKYFEYHSRNINYGLWC